MLRFLSIFLFACLLISPAEAKRRLASPSLNLKKVERLGELGDNLALRVYVKNNRNALLSYHSWRKVREILMEHEGVGYDLIYVWDRKQPKTSSNFKKARAIEIALRKADRLLLKKKFESAFQRYQKVANQIKPKLGQDGNNLNLYYSVLRGMGRSLYGARRYSEAAEVYGWIGATFPQYRQVLFEQTWAAFRAGKIDYALGALASQSSAYFSRYLEPEAYLLQVYIYKKLCRKKDFSRTLEELESFKEDLSSNRYELRDWAYGNLETRILYQLLEVEPNSKRRPILVRLSEKRKEQERIRRVLSKRHKVEIRRLKKQINLVLAYSKLAVTRSSRVLKAVQTLPSREDWLNAGLEIWPADSAEDWIDEIGTHRFLGDSLCKS